MGKNEMHFRTFDASFEDASDDYLLNVAFDPAALAQYDRTDTLNLIEELARRYQNLLDIVAAHDAFPKND